MYFFIVFLYDYFYYISVGHNYVHTIGEDYESVFLLLKGLSATKNCLEKLSKYVMRLVTNF